MRLFIITFLWAIKGFGQSAFTIELPPAAYDRENIPVKVLLKNPVRHGMYFRLTEKGTRKSTLARVDGNHLVFIPSKRIPAGKKMIYTVSPNTQTFSEAITFQTSSEGIRVLSNDKPVFLYQSATAQPPPDSPAYYRRSGFIHPLYTPAGVVLTDDFPASHTHQHAIFMAWVNTTFRGKKIDFWNQHHQTGNVEHVNIVEMTPGAVYGRLSLLLHHKALETGTVLEEKWTITIYPVKHNFLFDIVSEQTNITADTLFLHQYIYGGMAMRATKFWNKSASEYKGDSMQLVTSEGKTRAAANHTRARYVTMHGRIDGKNGGVTVFDHRQNFRYPQSIRVHPEMPYWVYAPVVDGKFEIPPGEVYRSKYRYFVFDKLPDQKKLHELEENWKAF